MFLHTYTSTLFGGDFVLATFSWIGAVVLACESLLFCAGKAGSAPFLLVGTHHLWGWKGQVRQKKKKTASSLASNFMASACFFIMSLNPGPQSFRVDPWKLVSSSARSTMSGLSSLRTSFLLSFEIWAAALPSTVMAPIRAASASVNGHVAFLHSFQGLHEGPYRVKDKGLYVG